MKLMKPIASSDIPSGNEWGYEVKYDGFRGVLRWDKDTIQLMSRNDHDLTANFPEIIQFCREHQSAISSLLPLELDGEIVVLNHTYQANFPWIQKRGRLKNKDPIEKAAHARPASFLAFDLLKRKGRSLWKKSFQDRKEMLGGIFEKMELARDVDATARLGYVPSYSDPDALWEVIFANKGEGMVAKRKNSTYKADKQHNDWFKIKNWRTIIGFLTALDTKNDYFTVDVYANSNTHTIGKCKHGLGEKELKTLKNLFMSKGEKQVGGYTLPPAICAQIHTLDLHKNELREPEFAGLAVNTAPADCTLEQLQLDLAMLPSKVDLTNTAKVFWPDGDVTKGDLLTYIREISPYMLPFLKERTLTMIRSPDGVKDERFFQKHLPDYAPSFIHSVAKGEERLIVCDRLESLVWFANHGTVEYHVPFQTIGSDYPSEIVFDLDPPDRERFPLAIQAALLIKQMLDDLELVSFVKTSGNKGMQIHIPITAGSISYGETAVLTEAIAKAIEHAHPKLFTTERLKRNRKERLYIDYVQHGKDKTIIAPYSPRLTDEATVAAPLFWEEVTDDLRPEQFTVENVVERVKEVGCPFAGFFDVGKKQMLDKVLALVGS